MPKRYTFEIVVEEGSDEFWAGIEREGKTGCDEVLTEVRAALADLIWDDNLIVLTKFETV